MPKKTTAKKTAKPKVKRQKLEREVNVEFILETPEQAKEVCAYLAQLETTMGWIFLKKMLQASLAVIEEQILTKTDMTTGMPLTDKDVDDLRAGRKAYRELINKPAQLIENITEGNVPTAPQYDPYASIRGSNDNFAGVMDEES